VSIHSLVGSDGRPKFGNLGIEDAKSALEDDQRLQIERNVMQPLHHAAWVK